MNQPIDGSSLDAFTCQHIVSRMTNCFDAGDFEAGLAFYAEDAVWHRPDGALTGRDAIAGYYRNRSPNAVICHVLTNFMVDFPSPDEALCTYYSMGFLCTPRTGRHACRCPWAARACYGAIMTGFAKPPRGGA